MAYVHTCQYFDPNVQLSSQAKTGKKGEIGKHKNRIPVTHPVLCCMYAQKAIFDHYWPNPAQGLFLGGHLIASHASSERNKWWGKKINIDKQTNANVWCWFMRTMNNRCGSHPMVKQAIFNLTRNGFLWSMIKQESEVLFGFLLVVAVIL